MKKLFFISIFFLLFFCHTEQTGVSAYPLETRPADPSLLSSLRQGGYILYVRHGEATEGEDLPNYDLNDCTTQRNLSETGKRQAVKYGELLRSLQIPIQTPVLASPFCRTRETAELAFGRDLVQTEPFWLKIFYLSAAMSPTEQQTTLNDFNSILEELPTPGKNKVIIAHSFPPGVGLGKIPYLGTVIVKPKGQGNGYEVAGRYTLDELLSLR